MTTRGTIETISSGELSDSGRNFPHVLIQVPADALPTFTLGQNLFLIPADRVAQLLERGELIASQRLAELAGAVTELHELVEAALARAEKGDS